ncbi:AI-2E family transporter [Pseudaeromonas sharmana]|uniref:AI-2E family transporter n=1 Tax=Pseudaeromonas sharmana TaxID=328412 RepID=A0ABV8CS21_9GAMM
MFNLFISWYRRRFSDPAAATLFLMLLGGFLTIYFLGDLIGPILVALVLAYLLEWPVQHLTRLGCSRTTACVLTLLFFLGVMLLLMTGLLPSIVRQGINLAREAPVMLAKLKIYLLRLPESYPDLMDVSLAETLLNTAQARLLSIGELIVSASFSSLVNLVLVLVYLILVPLMTFFMLKDKAVLLKATNRFLPSNRDLARQVWVEMNEQIVNYIRGKVIHILVVSLANYLMFYVMGINYALLLGVGVGLSVLIPYVGAVMITAPVIIVALFQWGMSPEFAYLLIAYLVVQALDANLLVPLLFSEAMNLHPIAIIIAVLIFGGLWGFWGVFFAIPLATLVKAVVNVWPNSSRVPTRATITNPNSSTQAD